MVDLGKQTTNSCGDLIFSSHMTFILSFVICYTYYGKVRLSLQASDAASLRVPTGPPHFVLWAGRSQSFEGPVTHYGCRGSCSR